MKKRLHFFGEMKNKIEIKNRPKINDCSHRQGAKLDQPAALKISLLNGVKESIKQNNF
jgi:hypothetical protein